MVRNQPANEQDAGDTGLTLASGRSPREGNGSPLQCPCLEDHMDRGAWWDYFRKSRMPPHCNEAITPPV